MLLSLHCGAALLTSASRRTHSHFQRVPRQTVSIVANGDIIKFIALVIFPPHPHKSTKCPLTSRITATLSSQPCSPAYPHLSPQSSVFLQSILVSSSHPLHFHYTLSTTFCLFTNPSLQLYADSSPLPSSPHCVLTHHCRTPCGLLLSLLPQLSC